MSSKQLLSAESCKTVTISLFLDWRRHESFEIVVTKINIASVFTYFSKHIEKVLL